MSPSRPPVDRGQQEAVTDIPTNTIVIGHRPLMAYATAVIVQINTGTPELSVYARDRLISRAVDVVQVCCRHFEGKLKIKGIDIGREVVGEGGETRSVPTIRIDLIKIDDMQTKKKIADTSREAPDTSEETIFKLVRPYVTGREGRTLYVTIPAEVRERVGLDENTHLYVKVDKSNRIILEKTRGEMKGLVRREKSYKLRNVT